MNIELIKKFVVESSVDEFTEFLESTDLDHFSTIQEILESHITQDDADKLQVLVESADIDLAVKAQDTLSSNYVVESEIKDCDTKLRLMQEDKSDIEKEYARREWDLHNTGMHNYKPSKPFTKASRNISDNPNVSKQVQSAYFKKLSDTNNISDAFKYEIFAKELSKNSAKNKKNREDDIKRKEAIQRANDELKSMRDAGAKNVNTTISNDSVKEVFNSLDKATEKLDTSEQTIQTGKLVGGVAIAVAASVGVLAVIKKLSSKAKSPDVKDLEKEANELVKKAKEISRDAKDGKISQAIAAAKVKMLNARVNKIKAKAEKVAEKESNTLKESVEDDIRELESQIEDVDDNFSSAKKKLVEGLYTKDEFQDISDNHEEKLQKLRDKIDELKEKEE